MLESVATQRKDLHGTLGKYMESVLENHRKDVGYIRLVAVSDALNHPATNSIIVWRLNPTTGLKTARFYFISFHPFSPTNP